MGDDMPDQAVKKFQKKLSAIRECEKKLIAISAEAMAMARKLPKESSSGLWIHIETSESIGTSGERQRLISFNLSSIVGVIHFLRYLVTITK